MKRSATENWFRALAAEKTTRLQRNLRIWRIIFRKRPRVNSSFFHPLCAKETVNKRWFTSHSQINGVFTLGHSRGRQRWRQSASLVADFPAARSEKSRANYIFGRTWFPGPWSCVNTPWVLILFRESRRLGSPSPAPSFRISVFIVKYRRLTDIRNWGHYRADRVERAVIASRGLMFIFLITVPRRRWARMQ